MFPFIEKIGKIKSRFGAFPLFLFEMVGLKYRAFTPRVMKPISFPFRWAAAAIVAATLGTSATTAQAATIIVTNLTDEISQGAHSDGTVSLREAIYSIYNRGPYNYDVMGKIIGSFGGPENDVVRFAPGLHGTVTIGQTYDLRHIDIDGGTGGVAFTTEQREEFSAGTLFQWTDNTSGAPCVLRNVTIKNVLSGFSSSAPLEISGGKVNLVNCTFSNNQGNRSGALRVSDGGTLNAVNCTFAGNASPNGDVSYSGAVAVEGATANLSNCTFSANSVLGTAGFGGVTGGFAINSYSLNPSVPTRVSIRNCVFAGNAAPDGRLQSVQSTIDLFSGSTGIATISSGGGNVFDDDPRTFPFFTPGTSDRFNTNPRLASAAVSDNGGIVPTIGLQTTSPARGLGVTITDELDADGDGDTSEILPCDARGPAFKRTVPLDSGAFQTPPTTSVNRAPIISSISIAFTRFGTNGLVTATVVASDPDGDALSYSFTWKKNGVIIPGQKGPTLDLSQPGFGDRGDRIQGFVTVTDARGKTASSQSNVLTIGNSAPVTVSTTVETRYGRPVIGRVRASDPDGDPLRFSSLGASNGKVTLDPNDGLFLFTPATSPTFTPEFSALVSDGQAQTFVNVTVNVSGGPSADVPILLALGADEVLNAGASDRYYGFVNRISPSLPSPSSPNFSPSIEAVEGFTAPDLFRAIGGQSLLTLGVRERPTATAILIGQNDVLRIAGVTPGTENEADFGPRIRSLINTLLQNTQSRIAIADVPRVGDLPFVATYAASKGLSATQTAALRVQLNDISARLSTTIAGVVATSGSRVALVHLQNDPRSTTLIAADGLHPNDAGHQLLAEKFSAALSSSSSSSFRITTKSNPSAPSS